MERSPTPFELIKGNEHHGPYIVNAYGGDVCDFYAMSNPSALSVRNGGDSRPIPFTCAEGNAEFMWRAANAHDALLAALENLVDLCEQIMVKPNECSEMFDARAAIALATQVQS